MEVVSLIITGESEHFHVIYRRVLTKIIKTNLFSPCTTIVEVVQTSQAVEAFPRVGMSAVTGKYITYVSCGCILGILFLLFRSSGNTGNANGGSVNINGSDR